MKTLPTKAELNLKISKDLLATAMVACSESGRGIGEILSCGLKDCCIAHGIWDPDKGFDDGFYKEIHFLHSILEDPNVNECWITRGLRYEELGEVNQKVVDKTSEAMNVTKENLVEFVNLYFKSLKLDNNDLSTTEEGDK